jgi:NTE family protein
MASSWNHKIRSALRSGVSSLREFAYAPSEPDDRNVPPAPERPIIGLALGGGFARGIAHLGVLKVLLENHIPIDALAGVSAGSIAAAGLASGATLEEMVEAARRTRWKSFARWTVDRRGLATNGRMEGMLRKLLRCSTFEELKKPLAVVATDIVTGEGVVFDRGELIPPLRGSCAFPGLFTPVAHQGRLLVDGAISGPVPATALRGLGVDAVIGVHFTNNGSDQVPSNIFQVLSQAFQITESRVRGTWRKECDVVIEPDMSAFAWDDFDRVDDMMAAGERAAWQALPDLLALLAPVPEPLVVNSDPRL